MALSIKTDFLVPELGTIVFIIVEETFHFILLLKLTFFFRRFEVLKVLVLGIPVMLFLAHFFILDVLIEVITPDEPIDFFFLSKGSLFTMLLILFSIEFFPKIFFERTVVLLAGIFQILLFS